MLWKKFVFSFTSFGVYKEQIICHYQYILQQAMDNKSFLVWKCTRPLAFAFCLNSTYKSIVGETQIYRNSNNVTLVFAWLGWSYSSFSIISSQVVFHTLVIATLYWTAMFKNCFKIKLVYIVFFGTSTVWVPTKCLLNKLAWKTW